MLLSETPDWLDLAALALPADSEAAVSIQYSAEYADTFGLLYAAMQQGERSERVLRLTRKCIDLSGSHYTAWDYRFQCLVAVEGDMEEEWAICHDMALRNAKNYQLWNHRRRCALRMGPANAPRDLEFAAHHLLADPKNYHIWAHRQALVAEYGLWSEEAVYVDEMLERDVRNNSAWNARAWLTTHRLASLTSASTPAPSSPAASAPCAQPERPSDSATAASEPPPADADAADVSDPASFTDPLSLTQVLLREVAYVEGTLARVPHNEAAWNYLSGLPHLLPAALQQRCLPRAAAPEPSAEPLASQSGSAQAGDAGAAPATETSSPRESAPGVRPSARAAAAAASAPMRAAVAEAVRAVDRETFRAALAVLQRVPTCVPARVALLKQYARAAGSAQLQGQASEQAAATQAVHTLVHTLVAADPLHAPWYRSVAASVA